MGGALQYVGLLLAEGGSNGIEQARGLFGEKAADLPGQSMVAVAA